MTITTSYGTWVNHGGTRLALEDTVRDALGDFAGDYDVDALIAAYRAAINEALPSEISLCGNEFIGPYDGTGIDWSPYPRPERDDQTVISAIIDQVDLYALAEKYDRS